MMFTVQYYCPRQANLGWQGNGQASTLEAALKLAYVVKPPHGLSRILDPHGNVVCTI